MNTSPSRPDDWADADQDPDVEFISEVSWPGAPLLVAFAGVGGAFGFPVFEFYTMLADVPVNKLFVRDLRRAWYHLGVPGLGRDLGEIAVAIRRRAEEAGASRLVTLGVSSGAYAALALGAIAGADGALAFSPQSFIDPVRRRRHGDDRWHEMVNPLYAVLGTQQPSYDLRWILRQHRDHGRLDVWFPLRHKLDTVHAARLLGVPGVRLRPKWTRDHNVARELRDDGKLRSVVEAMLDG